MPTTPAIITDRPGVITRQPIILRASQNPRVAIDPELLIKLESYQVIADMVELEKTNPFVIGQIKTQVQ